MVRGSLGKLASRAVSVAGRWQHQQLRRLNIHEYQVRIVPASQIPLHFFLEFSRSLLVVDCEAWLTG
jgi:ribosomal protein S30